jgi:hypothetical protein
LIAPTQHIKRNTGGARNPHKKGFVFPFIDKGLHRTRSLRLNDSDRSGDYVPFDLKHIRVIYYNVSDPFWGQKLIEKVAENILSALSNPEEAVFKRALNR